jgi:predicted permease
VAVPGLPRLFRLVVRPAPAEQDVDAEIAFHLEEETEALVARGLAPDQAAREARRRFGNLDEARVRLVRLDKEHIMRARRKDRFGDLWQDLSYALRGMRRSPGFTALVVVTLGLGIGANAAMFEVVDRTLLRPPAFLREPGLTGRVYTRQPAGSGGERVDNNLSYQLYQDFRANSRTLDAVATFYDAERVVGTGEGARTMNVSLVSAEFWPMFGVTPLAGRLFTPEEDRAPAGTPVAVLGYGYWQSQFGGDRAVLGRSIFVGARPYTVIGVAPPGFRGMSLRQVAMFIPVTAGAFDEAGEAYVRNYGFSWLDILARRKPGVSPEAAGADLTLAFRQSRLARSGAREESGGRWSAEFGPVLYDRGPNGREDTRVAVWLAAVAAIVLVIACANVANLLLARALRRRREIGVRLALGAGRARLLRQLLTESTLLVLLGAGAGLVVAHFGGGLLQRTLLDYVDWSAGGLFDGRILAFTALIALLTGVLTGVLPALQAGRTDVAGAIKSGGREGSHHGSRLRATLVAVQAALSVVLLVGAGLFLQSLRNATGVDLGYDHGRLIHVSTDYRGTRLTRPERHLLQGRMLERARAMPGVQAVGVTFGVPFWSSLNEDIFVPGQDSVARLGTFYLNRVAGDYFEATGTRILRGRALNEADRTGARVAVVSETMARKVWPGREAIGACLKLDADTMPCSTVVGIAQDVRWGSLGDDDRMQHYHPLPSDGRGALYVRVAGDPARLAEPLRVELQRLMPGTAIAAVRPLSFTLDPVLRPWRLGATMFTLFGGLALVVAAVGLYGVIAYSVAQRLHEMGVRAALGASGPQLVRLVMREGIRVAVIGVAIGGAAAALAARLLASMLFGVSERDPATYAAAAVVLIGVAAAASLLPAWRASRVDPTAALRAE